MTLLFLITYIAISYFIYKKNKENIENIPLIIQLTGIIAFALLFVYVIYYSGQNISSTSEEYLYVYSFYVLILSYLITFIVYLLKYKIILSENSKKIEIYDNKGRLDTLINAFYFSIIIFLSFVYLIANKLNLTSDDGLIILMYIFFFLSGLYILFENNILSLKYTKENK